MKYVALLSGGKDSCFNIVHCNLNGHELVAAASLRPNEGQEEIDSYLYQTVGQDAIEFIGRALDVPMYRKIIRGRAIEQGTEYGKRTDQHGVAGDETEDLFELLSEVQSRHPDIQGVSVGAILSNYQRVRVEHVCSRLGLTSLAYLWQRDQGDLLAEMIDNGLEAVLIKVAGIGLTMKHLGRSLSEMQPTLCKLHGLYGSHICGEGGEYESLTLDCAAFKSRITLTETETVIHSDNDFATVAYLRVKDATLVEKEKHDPLELLIPDYLTPSFAKIRDDITFTPVVTRVTYHHEDPLPTLPQVKLHDDWVTVSNVQSHHIEGTFLSLEEEVHHCFSTLKEQLAILRLDITHISFIGIYLSSIDHFGPMNLVYRRYFGSSPPARACVAVDLPKPLRIRLDCVAFRNASPVSRKALHVQGLSYWAPANIGPYSQAVVADEKIHVSGQIGLLPRSLTLPNPRSLGEETALASQHCQRILDALRQESGGGWVGHVQADLYWTTSVESVPYIKNAHERLQGGPHPTLYLTIKDLPKEALIEKQIIAHTGRNSVDQDGEITVEDHTPIYRANSSTNCLLYWEQSSLPGSTVTAICGKSDAHLSENDELVSILKPAQSARLFYVPPRFPEAIPLVQSLRETLGISGITPIPCRDISTQRNDGWDFAILITG